jgi:hypothetical protein
VLRRFSDKPGQSGDRVCAGIENMWTNHRSIPTRDRSGGQWIIDSPLAAGGGVSRRTLSSLTWSLFRPRSPQLRGTFHYMGVSMNKLAATLFLLKRRCARGDLVSR